MWGGVGDISLVHYGFRIGPIDVHNNSTEHTYDSFSEGHHQKKHAKTRHLKQRTNSKGSYIFFTLVHLPYTQKLFFPPSKALPLNRKRKQLPENGKIIFGGGDGKSENGKT